MGRVPLTTWGFSYGAKAVRRLRPAHENHVVIATQAEVVEGAHPLAALIPMMPEAEYEALRGDVAERGLLETIVLYEGKILDGRHRYRACIETATAPRFREFQGEDPVSFVVSLNVRRRHLSASQLAVIALDVERAYAARIPKGRPPAKDESPQIVADFPAEAGPRGEARDHAARVVGVNRQYVSDAKKVEREAPDLRPKVSAGELTIPEAKKEIRQREKAAKVAEIAKQIPAPLSSTGPFPVLYADPPWRYEYAEDVGRAVENNYPTMTLDEIKALEVPACDDAVLFLWATSPKLIEALDVMNAWGFTYRTCMVWVKDKIGMGYYARQRHELLLIGKRGNPGGP
jgi:MT-A70